MIKTTNYRVVATVAIVGFLASVFFLSKVYASLTIAFVLAYLLDPIVEKMVKKGIRRDLAVVFVLFTFFALLILGSVAVVPKLLAQARELLLRLPAAYHGVVAALTPYSQLYLGYDVFHDVNKLIESLDDPATLVKPIGGFVQGIFARTFRLITTILGLLIIPLLSYYVLHEYPHLYKRFLYLVPHRHHKLVGELRARLDAVLGGFIRGQLVVSSILSAYYATAFAILRLDLALVLGLMAGFFNVIPYLGITSVALLTLLIAFIHNATVGTYIGIGVVYAVGMAAEGSFLTPRIVGRKVGLGPLTLIIALLVGGELLGLVGMLLAVPIAAIAKVFFDVFFAHVRESESFKRN